MKLPDFFLIGSTRCGTSSLYKNLIRHPRIKGAKKEICFFDNHYEKGIEWYKNQFPDAGPEVSLCDASAMYLFCSQCPKLIHDWFPRTKLIAMLRDPTIRTWSHFCCNRKKMGPERQNLMQHNHPVLEWGIYADQLLRWFEYFGREQFLIIRSEDFFKDQGLILSECFKFLGLPDKKFESYEYWDPRKKKQNQGLGEHPKIPHETKKWLRQYFLPHNQRLYQLLERDFKWEKS